MADEIDPDFLEYLRTAPPIDDPDTNPDVIERDAQGNIVERKPMTIDECLEAIRSKRETVTNWLQSEP